MDTSTFSSPTLPGWSAGSNPVQTPQSGVEVTVAAKSDGKGFFLPFLGRGADGQRNRVHGDSISFKLAGNHQGRGVLVRTVESLSPNQTPDCMTRRRGLP